jgi:cobalt-zinc-cadmium resistance protein CzcA
VIDALVAWAVRHRLLVVILVAVLAVLGIITSRWLRFDALPDVTGRQVVVLTEAPGLTPEEVELRVTRPVETALGGLPGLVTLRSISRYGISSITAVFESGTDPLRARQLVQERVATVQGELPEGVGVPELGPLTGGLGEIHQFTLRSASHTQAQLRELVELRIAPLLRTAPGVVEVNSWGGKRRTLDVTGMPERMARHKVTLTALAEAVAAAHGQAPGGVLPAGDAGVLLRGVALPLTPKDLAAAVVRVEPDGTAVRVGDVAEVREGALANIGAATADGKGEVVYVMVQMLLDANALEVLEGVHARLDDVRRVLPPGVELEVVYDRSELVYATLRTVFTNLAEGGLLVVAVLFLMLGSFRAGLLVASVIPLSMLGAVAGMVALEVPGNLMSLGALDFGLLVDGAVVMVEAAFHRMQEHPKEDADRASAISSRAMARPVFFSVSIILLVYLPILSLSGVEGRMFRPMALTVVMALLAALVLSLTFVPAAMQLLLRRRDVPTRTPWLVRGAERLYRPMLDRVLRHPAVVGLGALGLLAWGLFLFDRAGTSFIPQLDEGDLVVQTVRRPDLRIETAVADSLRMEAEILRSVPEVRHVASRIGSPAVATDIMGIEQADVFIALAPRSEWRAEIDRESIIDEIEAAIQRSAPADEVAFTQPIQMRFNELVGGEVSDVALSIYGDDLRELRRLAEVAAQVLRSVEGAEDVRITAPPAVRLLEVVPEPLAAARLGMRASEVLAYVQAVRMGLDVGATYDGPLPVPIRVRYGKEEGALRFEALPLVTSQGQLVRLDAVAQVIRTEGPALVNHHEAQRRIVVGFNVRERDLGSVMEDARRVVEEAVSLPSGYRQVWGGQWESLQSARARLGVVIPGVLLAILALLWALFHRLRPSLIILLNVPFAAVGGIVALSARGLPVSISAAIGFIALSGIAVLNGVVLMNAILKAEAEGATPAEAARAAALERMRPVLMTASVAALGFLPMTLATGVGAEVQRPLATVVVGGLVSSTFLTLVILPTLYPWLSRRVAALGRSRR